MWGLRKPQLKETNRKEMRPLLKRRKCKGDTEAGGVCFHQPWWRLLRAGRTLVRGCFAQSSFSRSLQLFWIASERALCFEADTTQNLNSFFYFRICLKKKFEQQLQKPSGEVGKAAQEPLEVLCWLWDVSCLSYDTLHQKGHFRQWVPVPTPCWSCPQALPGHGQGWMDSGQQMSGCEKVSIYSAAFEEASFSSHPFHSSVWTHTSMIFV